MRCHLNLGPPGMLRPRLIAALFLASTAALMAGCATAGKALQPSVPNPYTSRTVGEYTHQLSMALMTPQIAFWAMALPLPGGKDNQATDDAILTFDVSWGKQAMALPVNHIWNDFDAMCSKRGGEWQMPYCRTPGNPDRVLFYATAEPNRGRRPDQGEEGFQTFVIEPRPGHETSPGYVDLLRARTGFMTRDDIAATAAQQRQRDAAARADAARAIAELPKLRTVGSKVCRVDDVWVSTGFVEQVSADKIQIRVVNVGYVKNENLHPGGGSSGDQIIWDVPSRWRLCE